MSKSRAVARTDRRQINQEVHLMKRELEQETSLYTEAELAMARIEGLEAMRARIGEVDKYTKETERFCFDLYMENVAENLRLQDKVQRLGTIQGDHLTLLTVAGSLIVRNREIRSEVAALAKTVESIVAALSLVQSVDHGSAGKTETSSDCGSGSEMSHTCGTSRSWGWSVCNTEAK